MVPSESSAYPASPPAATAVASVRLLTCTGTLLSQVPLRSGEPLLVGPPLFHGFGLAYLAMSLFLGSPLVLRRKFEPEAALAAVATHRVSTRVAASDPARSQMVS